MKPVKAETLKRIDVVVENLVNGIPIKVIYESYKDVWDIKYRQFQRYLCVAYKQIEKASSYNRKRYLGTALLRLESIYNQCIKQNDISNALKTVKQISDLCGLNYDVELIEKLNQLVNDRGRL